MECIVSNTPNKPGLGLVGNLVFTHHFLRHQPSFSILIFLYNILWWAVCESEKILFFSLSLSLSLFVCFASTLFLYIAWLLLLLLYIEIYNVCRHAHLLSTVLSCPQRKFVCLYLFVYFLRLCVLHALGCFTFCFIRQIRTDALYYGRTSIYPILGCFILHEYFLFRAAFWIEVRY